MMIKYAVALAILIVLAAIFARAFLPPRYLPGNRARHLRFRLHLRVYPGKGFAHVFSLHLRWGRLAALRRSARIRRTGRGGSRPRRARSLYGHPGGDRGK